MDQDGGGDEGSVQVIMMMILMMMMIMMMIMKGMRGGAGYMRTQGDNIQVSCH